MEKRATNRRPSEVLEIEAVNTRTTDTGGVIFLRKHQFKNKKDTEYMECRPGPIFARAWAGISVGPPARLYRRDWLGTLLYGHSRGRAPSSPPLHRCAIDLICIGPKSLAGAHSVRCRGSPRTWGGFLHLPPNLVAEPSTSVSRGGGHRERRKRGRRSIRVARRHVRVVTPTPGTRAEAKGRRGCAPERQGTRAGSVTGKTDTAASF
uniref:Uncharacterized protein n=1 Tax=Aegilops tauschii subsp. strangulata TaxID=200361 RepID=A0A453L9H0_AEGTS